MSYYKALVAQTNITRWSQVHNNSDCVKAIINKDYWSAMNKIKAGSSAYSLSAILPIFLGALVVIAIIVALLLFVYIRRKFKGKEDDEDTINDSELLSS